MYKKPISKRLLIHSLTYKRRLVVDEFQNETFESDITVNKVYCEIVLKTTNTSQGEMNQDTLMIYYDYKNSDPNDIDFKELDNVIFEGKTYTVRRKPNYLKHHVEVYCT